jgi:AmmeMemoRadiSam system protein A
MDEGSSDRSGGAAARAVLDRHGTTLLRLAAASIRHGLQYGQPLSVAAAEYAAELCQPGASFITLYQRERLRGCVGTPEARRPLIEDVAINAYAAAFNDPRFPRLVADECGELTLSISLLTPVSPLAFADEADLLRQLVPGRDGLIIESDGRRALFLPQVWSSLSQPADFLRQLKRKAGLDADQPAPDLRASRFAAVSLSSEERPDTTCLWR